MTTRYLLDRTLTAGEFPEVRYSMRRKTAIDGSDGFTEERVFDGLDFDTTIRKLRDMLAERDDTIERLEETAAADKVALAGIRELIADCRAEMEEARCIVRQAKAALTAPAANNT